MKALADVTPSVIPWRMPITILRRRLTFERPWAAHEDAAHNRLTSLRGALYAELFSDLCVDAHRCEPHGGECPRRGECPAGLLIKPKSRGWNRDHPPSISLIATVEEDLDVDLAIVLWGRGPSGNAARVGQSLRACGRGRLTLGGRPTTFEVGVEEEDRCTLGEWCARVASPQGPVVVSTRSASFQPRPSSFQGLIANAAHDLVQWDLEDSGASTGFGKAGCDAAGDGARKAVVEAFGRVELRTLYQSSEVGFRRSGSNHRRYSVHLTRMDVEISGDLASIWPWLRATSLRGPGGRLALGASDLSIYVPR